MMDEGTERKMNNKIEVIIPKLHASQLEDEDVSRELADVQTYIASLEFPRDEEVYLVFLRGEYEHITRKMTAVCVFVNCTQQQIIGLKSVIRFKFVKAIAELAAIHTFFPPEFIGSWNPYEGLLVHLSIPIRGLSSNQIFGVNDIEGELSDIELLIANAAQSEE
jgi:hypothetical protein